MPTVWELARRSEEHMKGMVLPGTMFEEMGLQLHRSDRRSRPQGAGEDAEEPARPQGSAVPAHRHAQGQRLSRPPKPTRSSGMGRAPSIRSAGTIYQGKVERPELLARCSASGSATWRHSTRASSRSRRPCAKARDSWSSRNDFPNATSMSASPNNMPLRSRRDSPARARSRSSRSTPRSCSAATIS